MNKMATNFQTISSEIEGPLECLECPICTNRFREPKLLDCYHTFCLKCLHELRTSERPRCTKIICPLCRRETTLKKKDVADLPNNFDMMALVEEFTKQEQLLIERVKEEVVNLVDKAQRNKMELDKFAKLVAEAKQNKAELELALEDIDKSLKKLDTMFANTKRKISKKAAKEVTRIKQAERKLMQEAEQIYKDRVKSFKNARATTSKEVTHAEHKLEEVNQLRARVDCYQSADLKKKLFDNLEEVTGIRPDVFPDSLAFMDFEEDEETPVAIGKMVMKDGPNPESKTIKKTPKHISTMQEGYRKKYWVEDPIPENEKLDTATVRKDKPANVDSKVSENGNKKDQWSPLNPNGKRKYDRDFLLQFQSVCINKPEGLPNIPGIILDKADIRPPSSDIPSMINDRGINFTPSENVESPHVSLSVYIMNNLGVQLLQALSSGSQQMTAGSQMSMTNHRRFIPVMQQLFINQNHQKRTATQ